MSLCDLVKKTIVPAAVAMGMYAQPANAAVTVDFTNTGVEKINSTLYTLSLNVQNNMDVEPTPTPYDDSVSEIKLQGIYSSMAPTFSSLPAQWGTGTYGYTTITLADGVNNLWNMTIGTTSPYSQIDAGSFLDFNINFTIPSGYDATQIQYGNVNAQGLTFSHGLEPNTPDTFTGPIGVIPEPSILYLFGAGLGLSLLSRRRENSNSN